MGILLVDYISPLWFLQSRLTRFEIYGAIGGDLTKTANFRLLHEANA